MKKWLKLILLLYTFIFSIELIKKSILFLAPSIKDFLLNNLTPIKAISTGWFATSIVQSSGAVDTVTATLAGNGLINLNISVYMIIGAALGTTITALIIALITVSQKRKDFRHGFEIGLYYTIYVALMVLIVSFLEFFFKAFSRSSLFLAQQLEDKVPLIAVPNFIEAITSPIIDPLFNASNKIFLIVLAFAILILSLKYIGKAVIEVFGGEEDAIAFINRHFDSKYKAYFIGVGLTAIVFSSSITISLLVPLAVARLISLRKAIPFILGADLGTFTDLFLASLIIGKTSALAVAIISFLFAILGTLLFLPNIEPMYRLTKRFSKGILQISRKKALYFLIAFILIPLLIIII